MTKGDFKFSIPNPDAWKPVAAQILDQHPEGGVFGLRGDLGAGKTTFVRAVIEEICRRMGKPAIRVTSPTFVFRQPYPELTPSVDHFDLYRLENITEPTLRELGVTEAIELAQESHGFVFIEWPEKIKPGELSLDATWTIEPEGEGRRLTMAKR